MLFIFIPNKIGRVLGVYLLGVCFVLGVGYFVALCMQQKNKG
jgi:hypothetical protein